MGLSRTASWVLFGLLVAACGPGQTADTRSAASPGTTEPSRTAPDQADPSAWTDPEIAELLVSDYVGYEVLEAVRIEHQDALLRLVLTAPEREVRSAAIRYLEDDESLSAVLDGTPYFELQFKAVRRIEDQDVLARLAARAPCTMIRAEAAARIQDGATLVRLFRSESSSLVRARILRSLRYLRRRDQLRELALSAYHREDRDEAWSELMQWPRSRKVWEEREEALARLEARVEALDEVTDPDRLLQAVLEGGPDVLCEPAARRLDRSAARQVALRSVRPGVLRIVVSKLTSPADLSEIESGAADAAVRLWAKKMLAGSTWDEWIGAATARGASAGELELVLRAGRLDGEDPLPVERIEEACLDLVRAGDEERIPEMVNLLFEHGHLFAVDYLNCGQVDLEFAARLWISRMGYEVVPGPGSHRATWGGPR